MKQTTSKPETAPTPHSSALVRRCDICGIINACDLDATPEGWKDLLLPDHTVLQVTEEEALELWKTAGQCDHKNMIEELRAQIHALNAQEHLQQNEKS